MMASIRGRDQGRPVWEADPTRPGPWLVASDATGPLWLGVVDVDVDVAFALVAGRFGAAVGQERRHWWVKEGPTMARWRLVAMLFFSSRQALVNVGTGQRCSSLRVIPALWRVSRIQG
jgi:hypothetical protein